MRILGHGIDIIECRRIEEVYNRHGARFLERLLTPAEMDYVVRRRFPIPHLAGRFAAKEAILKVLGTGWRGSIAWRDMEILNDRNGEPHVTLAGECDRIARAREIRRILVSITHTAHYAAASAIGLDEGDDPQTGDTPLVSRT